MGGNLHYHCAMFLIAVNPYGSVHDAPGKAEAPIWTPGKSIHTVNSHVHEPYEFLWSSRSES